MKKNFLLTILVFSVLICSAQKDSISIQELTIIQLEDEINDLNRTLENNNNHIKDLLIENEKLSNSNFEKVDGRLTNFIWLISVVGGIAIAVLTFFGWKYLSSSINTFFTERAHELSDAKLNKILTEKWIREQVEKKSEIPIKRAIENLQLDFLNISEQMINEEKSKMKQHHEKAVKTVEQIENLRDKIEKEESQSYLGKLNQEEKLKVKEASKTPKRIEDYNGEDWYWLGRNEYEENNLEEAINAFKKSIELGYNKPINLVFIALVKEKLGDLKTAISQLDEAILLNPNLASAWDIRGNIKIDLKLYNEAIQDFDEAIRLNPGNSNSFNNRGYVKNILGQFHEAIDDFLQGILVNDQSPNLHAHLAFSYLMIGELEKAEKSNKKAMLLKPNYNRPYFNQGLIHQKKGNLDEACKSWKISLDLGFMEAEEKIDEFCNSKD
ncbi:tetratricopeptide repeat protein [Flagellimonas marinaquae]|uniref:tetratricopeptide repeat protein n=1 Tax=Flagellimonas marinaquae TaxID=254955 RepID=UPI00207613CA|nr:tetratricopeptide repeat protein [Allomuricauda aquimarina]USD26750.1 hypothetical protein MJO53_07610 [Allomuricauda aquimarina]